MQFSDHKIWEPLKARGLHFCQLNINSLSYKIDELGDITNYIIPAILGITESKLDSSVTNVEVNINGYIIIRNERNRNGGSVACYIRNDLCFQILLNRLFSKFSYQKLNLLQSECFTDLQMKRFFKYIFKGFPAI